MLVKRFKEWAKLIHHFLRPGGIFYIMEGHPITHIFDDEKRGRLEIIYPYFHSKEPTKWDDDSPDYSDETYIAKNPSYQWQWSLSDIINSLIKAGLRIEFIHEFDKLFYKALPDMKKDKYGNPQKLDRNLHKIKVEI